MLKKQRLVPNGTGTVRQLTRLLRTIFAYGTGTGANIIYFKINVIAWMWLYVHFMQIFIRTRFNFLNADPDLARFETSTVRYSNPVSGCPQKRAGTGRDGSGSGFYLKVTFLPDFDLRTFSSFEQCCGTVTIYYGSGSGSDF
jgi:hypothetical protein